MTNLPLNTNPRRRRSIVLLGLVLALLGALLAAGRSPAGAAPATKRLTITLGTHHLRITVPRTWHVSKTAPSPGCGCGDQESAVCIVRSGNYDRDPYRCQLYIAEVTGDQQPDIPAPAWRLPACTRWTTVRDLDTTAMGHVADYREFHDRCAARYSEQWATVTDPQVIFWHPVKHSAADANAAHAAHTARLSGKVHVGRSSDIGRVRSVTRTKDGAIVRLDRVVPNASGAIINRNPKTYRYLVRPGFVDSGLGSCAKPLLSDCSAAQLVTQFHKGRHPKDGSRALDGALVSLGANSVATHSATPGMWIERYRSSRFTSYGDHGCNCG